MQNLYSIPGWFVDRLWKINPNGFGEIIIPLPPKSWQPKSKEWEEKEWVIDLENQTIKSWEMSNLIRNDSLPFPKEEWIKLVKFHWERLGNVKRRKVGGKKKNDDKLMETYQPRRRLSNAMKEASINLFFGTKIFDDIASKTNPLSTRNYMVWCPRLAELELIWYTDSHPKISGRLIFPTSVFKNKDSRAQFYKINAIRNPEGKYLFLHQPEIKQIPKFETILFNEHQNAFFRKKSLYVSLFDVRDEVCRRLRISAGTFDKLLQTLINRKNENYSISLETDIREDQSSGSQKLRRPIIINNLSYSLIAMTKK